MDEPFIAAKAPAVLELEPGTYKWCACGHSKNQPWCDGSHRGGPFRPTVVELKEAKRCAMCCCKKSANAPFCDGTHKGL